MRPRLNRTDYTPMSSHMNHAIVSDHMNAAVSNHTHYAAGTDQTVSAAFQQSADRTILANSRTMMYNYFMG